MDNVLVVGGAGFIGSHTARLLAESGVRTWATHRPARPHPLIPGVTWIESDLAARDSGSNWPRQCDSVLFLAQSSSYRDFPNSASDLLAVNVNSLHHALTHACKVGARSVVIASTGSAYSNTSKPASETDSIDLGVDRSFYVATKLASEILAKCYQKLVTVIQLRIFFPYGAGQKQDMLFPQLVQKVTSGRPISLHGSNGLTANPIYVSDVANAIVKCSHLSKSGVFNLAGPEVLTLRSIGDEIGRTVGRKAVFEVEADERPPSFVACTKSLRTALDWAPMTTLANGLQNWLKRESIEAA